MAKPLQQDSEGNIINDVETQKNQKGYANYEADLKKRQEEMTGKDAKTKREAQERALNAYNETVRGVVKRKKDPATSDYINMLSYGKNFEFKNAKDLKEKGGAAIEAADQEKQREAGRSPRSATMLESLGFKKGGKVSSASSRADGIAIRGKTRA